MSGAPQVGSDLEGRLFFALRATGLPAPTLQLRFDLTRRWRWDLAWPDAKVACEVQGGTWTRGRHVSATGIAKDCEKLTAGQLQGWLVVVVTGEHVRDGRAVEWIAEALRVRGAIELGDA